MHRVLILGAGKIGALISGLLAESGSYKVQLADMDGAGQVRFASQSLYERSAFETAEPIESQHRRIGPAGPGMLELRPESNQK